MTINDFNYFREYLRQHFLMKKYFLLSLVFFVSFASLTAQELLTKERPLPCLNKKFTIVVHTTIDSLGVTGLELDSVMVMLETLNFDFQPICTEFEICAFDTIPNYQYDILEEEEWEEVQTVYHQQRRINIFFVNSIAEALLNQQICGFSTQEGLLQTENGGIVIEKRCAGETVNPRLLSHLMGHYFGLLNTFEADPVNEELVDGSNAATTGDLIEDTAADPYILGDDAFTYVDLNLDCRFIDLKQDANSAYYVPDVGNIMSYYPCRCGFTLGQYERMVSVCRVAEGMW